PLPTLFSNFARPPPVTHPFPTRRSSDLDRFDNAASVRTQGDTIGKRFLLLAYNPDVAMVEGRMVKPYQYLIFYRSRLLDGNDDKDRKSTRLNSSHVKISYAVFCLKKKTK